MKLFLQPRASALEQARRITAEGSRFNIHLSQVRVDRTINLPLAALRALRAQNQHRSTFTIDNEQTLKAGGLIVITFREQASPRLFSSGPTAASGIFWIEPVSGRVMASTMIMDTGLTKATIRVAYAEEPRLKIWLPTIMEEEYLVHLSGVIRGRATYSNFRQARVETSTEIGKPPN
jgi:hypothetical protein